MKQDKAKAKLQAAELRVKASWQRALAQAHIRQAGKPIYPGQDIICSGKADVILALAAQNEAEADLLLAEIKPAELLAVY